MGRPALRRPCRRYGQELVHEGRPVHVHSYRYGLPRVPRHRGYPDRGSLAVFRVSWSRVGCLGFTCHVWRCCDSAETAPALLTWFWGRRDTEIGCCWRGGMSLCFLCVCAFHEKWFGLDTMSRAYAGTVV